MLCAMVILVSSYYKHCYLWLSKSLLNEKKMLINIFRNRESQLKIHRNTGLY